MKEMSPEDKQRIEKEAADCYSVEFNPVCWMVKREGYIAGATRENERMAELLKEERNKAIDEIKKHIGHRSYDVDGMPVVIEVQKLQQYLTSLKSQ